MAIPKKIEDRTLETWAGLRHGELPAARWAAEAGDQATKSAALKPALVTLAALLGVPVILFLLPFHIIAKIALSGVFCLGWLVPTILKCRESQLRLRAIEKQKAFVSLLPQIEKYNNVIRNMEVMKELKKVGNDVELSDSESMAEYLRSVRARLEKVVETERILRENPTFNPETIKAEYEPLGDHPVLDKASRYSELMKETSEVNAVVQREFDRLSAGA